MTSWRAVQTRPRYENYTKLALERADIPVFLPMLVMPAKTEPLFPTYLFADLETTPARVARYAVGVVDVIGTVPIAAVVIEELMARHAETIRPEMVPGRLYRLRRPGVLGQLLVRLERLDARARPVVLMHLLGLDREITVSAQDLEALDG